MRSLASVVAVVVAVALGVVLWLTVTTGKTKRDSNTVAAFGVALDLPSGWVGDIYQANRGARPPQAYLQATSFTAGGVGGLGRHDPTAMYVAEQMGSRDLLILLWETSGRGGTAYEPLSPGAAPTITSEDFTPIEGFSHPVARTYFTTRGRFFDLMVEFGSSSTHTADLGRANDVMAKLWIEPL
jgi:hypothetical protein